MPKIKTPYFILIGILAAACQVGLSRMESGADLTPHQATPLSDERQALDMDRSDPYGKFLDIR